MKQTTQFFLEGESPTLRSDLRHIFLTFTKSLSVVEGSIAAENDLRIGDQIIEVNGRSFELMTHTEGAEYMKNQSVLGMKVMVRIRAMDFRSSHHRCSIKKQFLKVLQYSPENTFVGVSFQ